MLDKYAEQGRRFAEDYFSITPFEKKSIGGSKKTYITSENRDKLLRYLSFGVLIVPLSMGLLLAVSRGYLSLSGRARLTTDETKRIGPRTLETINELPTSPHAGIILAKMNDNLAQPGKPERYLQFLRKVDSNDASGERKWRSIGASNKKYNENEFIPIEFGTCRLERETTKSEKGGDLTACNIHIEGHSYRLPVSVEYGGKLWGIHDHIMELTHVTQDSGLPTQFEHAPFKTLEPALTSSFITDKDQVFKEKTIHNDIQTTTILQAKSTLAGGECCADWAVLESRDNLTLALVADAAGNKPEAHEGSVKLVNLFRENFWKQLDHPENQGLQDALGQALMLTEIETFADSEATCSTMACVAITTDQDGDRYAVGFCIGDARVMLKRQEDNSLDLTPTTFSSSYSDQGANFGGRLFNAGVIFQKLKEGDSVLLGSDGFGDNMEAKSMGKTPLAALQELYEAGKLNDADGLKQLAEKPEDWIENATSASYWTSEDPNVKTPEAEAARMWLNGLDDTQKKLLQELHTLYSQFILDGMNDDDIASQIHANCTQTLLVHAGTFKIGIDKKIAKVMADLDIQNKASDIIITKEDLKMQLEAKLKELGIFSDSLEAYKDYAVNLVSMSTMEKNALFDEWDKDPSKAHEWMGYRVGKPDDFSLISLTILPKENSFSASR